MTDTAPDAAAPDPAEPLPWHRRAAGLFGGTGQDAPGDPRRSIRTGLWAAFAFFVLFIGWAAIARLDAGVTAHGSVVVAGNRKAVQHRDGGIIERVYVREGDRVRAGQELVRLAADEPRARERSVSSQVIGLMAYRARLAAEIAAAPRIDFPREFAAMTGDDLADARINMQVQQKEFAIRRLALQTEKDVLRQRITELGHQAASDRAQVAASSRQKALIGDELIGIRELEAQGYVARSKVRELERAEAEYGGSMGQYSGSVAKTLSSVGETRVQMVSLDKNQAADAATQYRDADLKLADLQPQLASLRAQLARTVIRAPATGRIVALKVFTNGGVIPPGEMLMEIVPDNQTLVVSAQLDPNDIDDLVIGQRTEIRIPAFHDRGLPILNGRITKISADRLVDAKSEKPYFEIEVAVPPAELRKIRTERGTRSDLIAGLPVEVLITQRRRTALDYFLEPLGQALWRSFREQ